MNNNLHGVYFITDTSIQSRFTHLDLTKMAVEAGVHMVQYRDKKASARQALAEIEEISTLTREAETKLIVNDRADLALAGRADGVHLGQEDLPITAARSVIEEGMLIGGTSSTLEEAQQVERLNADYVALGHIFETSTKEKGYPPRGLETLREVASAVSIPLVAIGGITLQNAHRVIEAGADIIALSSAICAAKDPLITAKKFVALFD